MNADANQITIRRAELTDCAGLSRVHVDTWQSTYRGIVPQAFLDQLDVLAREKRWVDLLSESKPHDCNFVAQIPKGSIIGFSSGGRQRDGIAGYSGERYAVYLLQDYHRMGIGRRLVSAVVADLISQELFSMIVWVLAAIPACAFYERLGGIVVDEKLINIGGADLRELAYGWSDVRKLAGAVP